MKLVDIVILIVVLSVFCPLLSGELKVVRELDLRIEELRMKNDCVRFITESFLKTCERLDEKKSVNEKTVNGSVANTSVVNTKSGCSKALWDRAGFEDLNEWAAGCKVMWRLKVVEWKVEGAVICGTWSGPYGNGTVYYRRCEKDVSAEKLDS